MCHHWRGMRWTCKRRRLWNLGALCHMTLERIFIGWPKWQWDDPRPHKFHFMLVSRGSGGRYMYVMVLDSWIELFDNLAISDCEKLVQIPPWNWCCKLEFIWQYFLSFSSHWWEHLRYMQLFIGYMPFRSNKYDWKETHIHVGSQYVLYNRKPLKKVWNREVAEPKIRKNAKMWCPDLFINLFWKYSGEPV